MFPILGDATAAGGLLPTGEPSIATRTTVNQPPLRLYSIEEAKSTKTPTPYVSYDSIFFQMNNVPAAPFCRRVIEKIGCLMLVVQGRLYACPFLGSWRALLCGEVHVRAGWGCNVFWRIDDSGLKSLRELYGKKYLRRAYSGQFAGSSKLGRL